jgi:uncharacterized protein YgbK (DUF1537 family)
VPLATVRRGPGAVSARLARGLRAVVADAEQDEDLWALARAIGPDILPAGSAGLATALAGALAPDHPPASIQVARPLLVVAGSAHPVATRQLDRLRAHGVPSATIRREVEGVSAHWTRADAFALTVSREALEAPTSARAEMAARLAAAAAALLREGPPRRPTLVLVGGETAVAVCRALGATAIAVRGPVEPGVALGSLRDGPWAGLVVVTKAGGFGDAATLVRILERAA